MTASHSHLLYITASAHEPFVNMGVTFKKLTQDIITQLEKTMVFQPKQESTFSNYALEISIPMWMEIKEKKNIPTKQISYLKKSGKNFFELCLPYSTVDR